MTKMQNKLKGTYEQFNLQLNYVILSAPLTYDKYCTYLLCDRCVNCFFLVRVSGKKHIFISPEIHLEERHVEF